MKLPKIFSVFFLLMSSVLTFTPSIASRRPTVLYAEPPQLDDEEPPLVQMVTSSPNKGLFGFVSNRITSKVAGWVSGLCGYVARGMAEDIEYADLPPPYVPAIFGVVLLAGVGILTASLGDVMEEGTFQW